MKHDITLFLIAAVALTAASLGAQDLLPKAAPQQGPIAVVGGTIHTVSNGTLENGTLLFEGGVITAVLPGAMDTAALPAGTEVIDARDKHLFPGFVCAASILGLTEVGAVDMTLDHNEAGSFTPEVVAAVAVNPDSWLIPVTRRNGVLTCGVMPTGGRVSGRASVLQLDGWTTEQMAVEWDAGLVVSWPRIRQPGDDDKTTLTEQLQPLDDLFDGAAAYLAARRHDPDLPTDLRYEAMSTVLAGERPLFINASRVRQIETAVLWAVEREMRPVIIGGHGAAACLDLLRRHDVGVAVTSAHRLPSRRDLSFAEPYELPGLLEQAGVRWCLSMSTYGTSNARNLPYEAAACIGYGLAPDVALRSVTLAAAEVLGVDDRLGSLDAGKLATFFVADGDPFELSTTIERAYIGGRAIALRDKQTELDAKYREKYRQLGLISGTR